MTEPEEKKPEEIDEGKMFLSCLTVLIALIAVTSFTFYFGTFIKGLGAGLALAAANLFFALVSADAAAEAIAWGRRVPSRPLIDGGTRATMAAFWPFTLVVAGLFVIYGIITRAIDSEL